MRCSHAIQESLFTIPKLDGFVLPDHALRDIATLVNSVLEGLNDLFNRIYADRGCASVPPEKLMRALLLQLFYSIQDDERCNEVAGSSLSVVGYGQI